MILEQKNCFKKDLESLNYTIMYQQTAYVYAKPSRRETC